MSEVWMQQSVMYCGALCCGHHRAQLFCLALALLVVCRRLRRQRCGESDSGDGGDEDHWSAQKRARPSRLLHAGRYERLHDGGFVVISRDWITCRVVSVLDSGAVLGNW